MTEQDALWKEDSEEMTKMLFWVHENTKKMSYVNCYLLKDNGILFMVSEAVDKNCQLFIDFDTLFERFNAGAGLNIEEKARFAIQLEIEVPPHSYNTAEALTIMLREYLISRISEVKIARLDINGY